MRKLNNNCAIRTLIIKFICRKIKDQIKLFKDDYWTLKTLKCLLASHFKEIFYLKITKWFNDK